MALYNKSQTGLEGSNPPPKPQPDKSIRISKMTYDELIEMKAKLIIILKEDLSIDKTIHEAIGYAKDQIRERTDNLGYR